MTQDRDHDDGKSGFDSLADGTGMDRPDDAQAMRSGRDVDDASATDEASGDAKTAVEGLAAHGALNQAWGGVPTNAEGGAGTHVPADGDEHMTDASDARSDTSDPRGY